MECSAKYDKIELELISDAKRYFFFEKSMTDGVSYISKRFSKASNKYLTSYDPKQKSRHVYWDANSFYGYAMSKFLPTGGFTWIDPIIQEFDLNKYSSNSSKGFILGVDLEYPNNYIVCAMIIPPEKINKKEEELLSKYQLLISDFHNIPTGSFKNLVCNFFDKEKYVLDHENLQLF